MTQHSKLNAKMYISGVPREICNYFQIFFLIPGRSRLPYLDVNVEERVDLERRLIAESSKMQNQFQSLASQTRDSLLAQCISVSSLEYLFRGSSFTLVYKAIKDINEFNDLMSCLSDYWSFFNYELLQFIIKRYCRGLTDELEKYKGEFKLFCERRLCEVPEGTLGVKAEEKKCMCCLKMDNKFSYKYSKIGDIKNLEDELSNLLNRKLILRRIDEGCLNITFICLSCKPLLTSLLKQQLRRLGVLK